MNKIYYYAHLLLQSRMLYFIYFYIIISLLSIFNTTTHCDVDNDKAIKEEFVKKNNYDYRGVILFSFIIIFNIFALPYLLDGTFLEKYFGIMSEKTFNEMVDEMCRPISPEELAAVEDAAEEWARQDLRNV